MSTPQEVALGSIRAPTPDEIEALRAEIAEALELYRGELFTFARDEIRDVAKRVAIAQNGRTLKLGKTEIQRLKQAIDDLVASLPQKIAQEFTLERHTDVQAASSGQVGMLVSRRFEMGTRRLLAEVNPVLERAGYKADHHMFEPDEPSRDRAHLLRPLVLSAPLADCVRRVADALTELKVGEAKLDYFERKKQRRAAQELWDQA